MWRTVLVGYSQFLQLFFLPAHSWESHTGPPQTAITQSHHTESANEVVTQGHHTRPSHSWITQSHQTGSSHRIIIQCHHILTQDRHKESAHRGITQDHHKRSSQTIIPQGHQIWSHRIITKGQHTESSHTVITKSHHKGSSNRGHWEDKFCCVCETKPVGNLIGRYRLDQITIFVAQFFGRINYLLQLLSTTSFQHEDIWNKEINSHLWHQIPLIHYKRHPPLRQYSATKSSHHTP